MWRRLFYLFDTSAFPPRWQCGGGWQQEPFWGWLHIGSDVAIWGAYTAIPFVLIYFLRKRPDLPFPKILWLFVAFIFACGTVHLVEATLFWWPAYRFSGLVKLTTAVVSWATVFALLPLLPLVFAFRTPAQLEDLVRQRTEELQALAKQLQREVEQRTEIARELGEKEARLRLALRAGRMGTWDWELSTGATVLDPVERELTGLTGDVIHIESFYDRVLPDDVPELRSAVRRAVENGEEYNHEFRWKMPDGRVRWLAGRGEVEFNAADQAVRMRGVNFDITEERTAREQMLESEAFLRSILDSSADNIQVLDGDGRLLSMNPPGLRAMEIDDLTTVQGSDWRAFWPDICPDELAQAIQAAVSGGQGRFQGNCKTAKGQMKTCDVICTRIGTGVGGQQRILCISRDITELRTVSKARQESEERFRVLADNIAPFAWMTDETGAIVWFNKRWFDYTGTTVDQVKGWGWQTVAHPDHAERVVKKFRECLRTGVEWDDTFPLRAADGSYRWFLSRARAIRDENGKILQWFGSNTDITDQMAAERSLARAHAQLESIVNAAADGIVTLDEKGRILSANSTVEQLFGFPTEEVVGRPIVDFIAWAKKHVTDAQAPRGFLVGKGLEAIGKKKDGTVVPLEVSVSDTNLGKRKLYAAIIRDVTERKRTEETLRIRLRAIEFATNGILITDAHSPDNAIVYVNPAFEQLTGYSSAETLGRNCRFLQGKGTDPEAVAVMRDAIRDRLECRVTLLNYRKDGSRFWNEVHVSPVQDDQGDVTHFIGIQSDITGRIRYEHRLREAQIQADSANRAKSEFLANVSHEIRTPMTAILGCADSLYRQLDDPDPKDVVRMIRDQGQLLLGILNDVLDLSKIEAGKLEIHVELCDPVRVIGDVHSLMHSQAVEKGIELRTTYQTQIPDVIETDPLRFRQILLNVVSNAIKFTEKGYVEVQVSSRRRAQQMVLHIAVKDTGIGIPPDRIDTIFEAFVQQPNPLTARFHGTGLGLTICQKLVQMLGGSITVSSAEGEGSTFVIELPVGSIGPLQMKNPDELIRRTATRDSQMSMDVFIPCRVLVAEDTRAIQFMLTRMLTDSVTSLAVAENGEQAIAAVEKAAASGTPFDLLLMDMHMPVLNGFDATRKLRELGFTLPIIALTAGAMAGDREKCLAAGCTDYLPKPIDRVELFGKLEQYCGE